MIRSKKMTFAAAALALLVGGQAFAQHGDWQRQDGPRDRAPVVVRTPGPVVVQSPGSQGWDHGRRGDDRYDRHDHDRRDRRDDYRAYRERQDAYRARAWDHRGGYVPRDYRAPRYVVNDWRARQLQAPPSGYQWLDTGGQFALAAIATGLIAQIVAGH